MRKVRSERLIRKRKRDVGLDKFSESFSAYEKRACSSNSRIEFPQANEKPKKSHYSPYSETFPQANGTPKRSNYSPYPETFLQANETPKRSEYSPYSETFSQANKTPKRSDYSPYTETFLQANEAPKRSDYSPYFATFPQATAFNCTRSYETTTSKDKCTMQLPYQLRSMNNYHYQNEYETLSVKGVPWYNYYGRESFPYKRRRSSQASGRPRRLNYSRYPQAKTFNSTNYYETTNARDNYMTQFPRVEDSINNYHCTTESKILPIQSAQEPWHQYNLGMNEYLAPSNTIVSETDSSFYDKNSLPEYFLNPTPKFKSSSCYPSNAQTPLNDCYIIDPSSEHFLQSLEKDKIQSELTDNVSFTNNYFSNSTSAQTPSSSNHDCLLLDPNENQKSAESVSSNTISPCMKDIESVFMYSNILNADIFLSEFETSLSSITNYILDEPKYSESFEKPCGMNDCKRSVTYHENDPGHFVCPQVENTTGEVKDNASEVKPSKVDDMKTISSELINDMFNLYLCDVSESDDSKIMSSEFINEISDLYLDDIFKTDTSNESSENNQINKTEDKSCSCEKELQFNEETDKNFNTDNHNYVLQIAPKHCPNKYDIGVQTEAENHFNKCDVSIQTETKNHGLKRTVSIQTEIPNYLLKCDASIQTELKNCKLQHNVSVQTETKNHSFKRDVSIQKETKDRSFKDAASVQTGIKDFPTSSSETHCNDFLVRKCPTNLVKILNNISKDVKTRQRIVDNVKSNETCKSKTEFKADNSKYEAKLLKKHPQNEVANHLMTSKNLNLDSNSKMTETTNFQKKLLPDKRKEFEINEAYSRDCHENVIKTSNIERDINTLSIEKFENRTDQINKREDILVNEKMCIPHKTEILKKIRVKIEKYDCKKLRRSPRLNKL